jgi:hypothetical protein
MNTETIIVVKSKKTIFKVHRFNRAKLRKVVSSARMLSNSK